MGEIPYHIVHGTGWHCLGVWYSNPVGVSIKVTIELDRLASAVAAMIIIIMAREHWLALFVDRVVAVLLKKIRFVACGRCEQNVIPVTWSGLASQGTFKQK